MTPQTGDVPRLAAGIRLFAHRGASGAAPENTLAAIGMAAAEGARAVELDVSRLADGTLVLHHDASLGRTAPGGAALATLSRGDLAGLDAGGWFGPAFAGERIPTLDAALGLIDALGLAANLEMKPHEGDVAPLAEGLADALAARAWTATRVTVSSFSEPALAAFRRAAPDHAVAMLWGAPPADWADVLARLGAEALHVDWRHAEAALADAAHRAGARLRVYTANDPAALAPLRERLDGVITDHPRRYLDDPGWADWTRGLTG